MGAAGTGEDRDNNNRSNQDMHNHNHSRRTIHNINNAWVLSLQALVELKMTPQAATRLPLK